MLQFRRVPPQRALKLEGRARTQDRRAGGFAACLSAGGAALLAAAPALADVPGALRPPPTDLTQPQAPLAAPAVPLVIHSRAAGAAPAGAADIQVQVTSIELVGVTAYKPGQLDPIWQGLVGKTVRLAALFEAAARIEARYRADGYVLTRAVVPEQSVPDGRFRIRVIEGYVGNVELTGDAAASEPLIRSYLDKITQARPARLRDIERYLLLANDLPGISARAVLTGDPDALGAAKLVVEVAKKPVDAFGTINNQGSVFAGPLTATVGLAINDLGPVGGRLAATYFDAGFDDSQQFGQIEASAHFGSEGLLVRAWASDSPSHPGSIFAPIDINSVSTVFGVGASYPLIRSRRMDFGVQGSFEVTHDTTRVLDVMVSRDDMRIIRIGLTGDYHDDAQGVTSGSITLHQGLDVGGASHAGDPIPQSRLGGRSDFTKLTATVSHLQPLYQGPSGSLALQVSAAGQVTGDRLLSTEQFQIGGEEYGRDYNPGQLAGDDGAGVDAELQYTDFNAIGPVLRHQFYGFFDAATVKNLSGGGWGSLQSAGAGVRADLGPHVSVQFELAVPYDPGRLNAAHHNTGVVGFFSLTARY